MKRLKVTLEWGDVGEEPVLSQIGQVDYMGDVNESHINVYGEMLDKIFIDALNHLFRDIEREGK